MISGAIGFLKTRFALDAAGEGWAASCALLGLAKEGRNRKLSKKDYAILRDYHWPGNVHQLIKLIDRAVLLDMPMDEAIAEEKALGELVLYDEENAAAQDAFLPHRQEDVLALEEVKKRYAAHVWALFEKNGTATARALDITANTLRTLLKE